MENPFKKAVENMGASNGSEPENTDSEVLESDFGAQEAINPEESGAAEAAQTQDNAGDNVSGEVESASEPWKEKYEALNNQYIRLAADFDNYRKRQAQERENLLKYGAENTVKKFIEVMDNFDRGLKAIESVDDCEKVKECYNLAYKNFYDVMTKAGVEAIKSVGEEFDPNLHEAVMQTPTDEHPEHTVIAELQKGYKLSDRVLRPALVNVAVKQD